MPGGSVMKFWSLLLSAALFCGLLINPPAAQADEAGHGMILNSPHLGMLYLYVTANGIALVLPKTGAKIVLHSPQWQVVMYNDKSKVYYVESMEEVSMLDGKGSKRSRTAQALARRASSNSIRKGKTAIIAGKTATQYLIHTMSDSGPKLAETWVTTDFNPPKQLIDLLGKLFRIDTVNFPQGMPLRVKLSDDAGKRDMIFDTLKCEDQSIKTASFTYPSTYKRVDNEIAVVVDEKSRKKMEAILEDSDELSSILGSSSSSHASSYRSGSTYRPATGSSSAYSRPSGYQYQPTRTSQPVRQQPAQNDWWGNMMKNLSGGK
jgi:hypothetical protein